MELPYGRYTGNSYELRYRQHINVSVWDITSALRLNLQAGRVQPYIKAGYGLTCLAFPAGPSTDRTDVRLTGQLGGGVEYFTGKDYDGVDVSVRLEYSYMHRRKHIESSPDLPGNAVSFLLRFSK